MTAKTTIYPLRLPVSIRSEAEKLAAAEGTSLNQFVATAVAEKVAVSRTASY
jgi:predicted HicB family RNase H-like nuclease